MANADDRVVITEVLKDYIVGEKGKSIRLECKLSQPLEEPNIIGIWYKNSDIIIPSTRVKIRSEEELQILELKGLIKKDEGIYSFVVKSCFYDVYTKCTLFIKTNPYPTVTHYYRDYFDEGAGVFSQLRNFNVQEGEKFILLVQFASNVQMCEWYKNDVAMPMRYPRFLMEEFENSICKIYFDRVKMSDSGMYTAVGRTYDDKYLCSFAQILVGNDFVNGYYNNEMVPHIWKMPKCRTEVYDEDDVTLIFKVTYDSNTTVEWLKNGNVLNYDDRTICEMYDNRYIGLKLLNVSTSEKGRYSLVVRNNTTLLEKTASADLAVKQYNSVRPRAIVTKDLHPTIASVGNGATFQCSFDSTDYKYTYVVWIVGCHKIEKSNEKFKVLCNGMEFILYIPMIVPEMAGEVICQLRKHIPLRESILLSKSECILTVVPPQNINFENCGPRLVFLKNVYCNINLIMSITDPNPEENIIANRDKDNFTIMCFQFCKISTTHYLFEIVDEQNGLDIQSVTVVKITITDPNALVPKPDDWKITWKRDITREWYGIDIHQPQGRYSEIGISSSPILIIKGPPEDKLYKFRIRCVKTRKRRTSSHISFTPAEVALRDFRVSRQILPYKDYKKSYITDMRIGQGNFCFVNLVHNVGGQRCTAKNTKFIDADETVLTSREFSIMKNLFHPNTVKLYDCFIRRNTLGLIFIMEYLWGGELIEEVIDRQNLSELDIIVYVRQILLALEYLHSKNIVHFDLKTENIMCINRNSRIIKLIDFGMARVVEQAVTLPIMYGSRDYVSPELIHNELIGTYCDMWSFGVLTYWLLTGKKPFAGSSWIEKSRNISEVSYTYDDMQFRVISDRAKTFVSYLLRRRPDDRMTAIMALNDDWITEGPEEGPPVKVAQRARGAIDFVEITTPTQLKWKILTNVLMLVVKLLAGHRSRQNPQTDRRCSARVRARYPSIN